MIQDLLIELKDFTIVDTLGSGGFGVVHLVEEKSTGKLFAAKVSQKECKTVQDQKSLFQEILSYSKIKNNAILSLYGFNLLNFKGDHYPTIILPYMPNKSLDKLIKENKAFPLSKRYIILLGIAKGMKYLHSIKIIHRDLKPGNVLLDEKYRPYISDFGTAKLSENSFSKLKMDTYTGTEIYMAPEVIKGESYTHKIDIYSFSILAYELITSTFPFPGYNTAFLIQKAVLKGKRPDLSLIPDETIRNLLSKCWSEKPKLRPDFSEIVDIIKSDNFKKAMKADKIEVENYLCRFDDEPAVYSFIFSNGKICSSKFLPSMKAEEVLKVLQKEKRYVEDDSYFVFHWASC